MRKYLLILLLILFYSCQYFDKRVPDEEELLQKRLDEINWKEVSTYPSVPECDAILDKELRKECFFSALTGLVQEKLATGPLEGINGEADTIKVRVTVFPDGSLQFEPQFPDGETAYNKTKTDSIFKSRLADFPAVEPAQKEGVPVKTQFILPVILDAR